MGWVSPTGHNDPDSEWAGEPLAYDDNELTFAYTETEGSYLELTLGSAISCDKIQIYANEFGPDTDPNVAIDVYYGAAWHNIFAGVIARETWVEKAIGSTQSVTKARVKWNVAAEEFLRLFEFDFWEVEEVIVTPSPASNVAATIIGAVILGSLSLTPTPASAVATKVNPTVVLGSTLVSPSPASAIAAKVDPTVVKGSITLAPTAISVVSAKIDPTVVLGSTSATPTPIAVIATKVDPTVVLGSTSFSPDVLSAIATKVDPAVLIRIIGREGAPPIGVITREEWIGMWCCGSEVVLCGSEYYTCGGGYSAIRVSQPAGTITRESVPAGIITREGLPLAGTITRENAPS